MEASMTIQSPEMTRTEKRLRTQWSTQFLAAAELVRRGDTVAFTMGNYTPVADLMVGAPSGTQFWVDVKGLGAQSSWLVRPKPNRQNLFYILVCLAPLGTHGKERKPDRFFVLTQKQANDLINRSRKEHPGDKGTMPGFPWSYAIGFEDKWSALPG